VVDSATTLWSTGGVVKAALQTVTDRAVEKSYVTTTGLEVARSSWVTKELRAMFNVKGTEDLERLNEALRLAQLSR